MDCRVDIKHTGDFAMDILDQTNLTLCSLVSKLTVQRTKCIAGTELVSNQCMPCKEGQYGFGSEGGCYDCRNGAKCSKGAR